MNNSRTMNSLKNIITGFVGQFLQLGISFISRIIFVRCLSEAYLGVNGLFTNILSMLSLAELGISSAISYALYKPLAEHDNSKIAALMGFYANAYKIIGIVIGIAGVILIPFLDFFISDPGNIKEDIRIIYCIFLFNTVLSYFFSYKTTLITADQKSYLISTISYSILFIQTIIQIVVLLITNNYLVYLVCQSVGTLITNIALSKAADRLYPMIRQKKENQFELSKEDKKSLFVNIKALMIIKISGVLVNSTDNIIISATKGLGLVSTGIASNYTLLTSTLNTIINQIFNGITASVGNLNAVTNEKDRKYFFNIINLMNFWLYGWSAVAFLVLSNDIVFLLFGGNYVLDFSVVFILAVNYYTVGMQNAIWTYKNTLGLFNYGKYLILITGIINIILSILLGQKLGLFGIFFATFISRLLTNLWYDPYAVFKYGLKANIRSYLLRYLYFIFILIIEYIFIKFLISMFAFNNQIILNFLIKLIICIIIPNIINILFFFKTKEYQYVFYKFKSLIKLNK